MNDLQTIEQAENYLVLAGAFGIIMLIAYVIFKLHDILKEMVKIRKALEWRNITIARFVKSRKG